MWRVDEQIQPDNTIHVWPDPDTIEHNCVGPCVCGPELEEHLAAVLVIHHVLDGPP